MSDDDRDDSRKVGLWVVFASVAVLLLGVLGFAVTRTLKGPSAPAAQTAAAAASTGETDVLVDLNPTGPALAVLYFETGSASVGAEDAAALAEVVKALAGDGARRVLLSGYHDSTGDPAMNAELLGMEVDAVFFDQRIAVELDGYAFHSGAIQWENDHEKRARLVGAGWTVLAYSWRQQHEDGGRFVQETLGSALRRCGRRQD